MSDEPIYAPNKKAEPPRQPQPGKRLFELRCGSDRFVCELRDHGEFGVEAMFLLGGELFFSRRFDTRALAVQWATVERDVVEKGGAS